MPTSELAIAVVAGIVDRPPEGRPSASVARMDRKLAPRLLLPAAALTAAALIVLAVAPTPAAERAGGGAVAAGAVDRDRSAVPILMYHAIRTAPADARLPSLFVRPRRFAEQIRALRRAGYRAVTLQRVWEAWHGRARLPRRPIVISFDDGYASHVRIALPVLRRERWPGVLHLALDWVDELGGVRAARRLIDAGWEIDGHSRTHADLRRVSADRLADETAGARAELRRRLGVRASFFAYPGGRYDARVVAAVRKAGYLAATTVSRGFARPAAPYELARVQVSGAISGRALLRRMRQLRSRSAASADQDRRSTSIAWPMPPATHIDSIP
ncbi:MAG: polysaccharide deacetylase family protein [Thermoleophilia bacterium]